MTSSSNLFRSALRHSCRCKFFIFNCSINNNFMSQIQSKTWPKRLRYFVIIYRTLKILCFAMLFDEPDIHQKCSFIWGGGLDLHLIHSSWAREPTPQTGSDRFSHFLQVLPVWQPRIQNTVQDMHRKLITACIQAMRVKNCKKKTKQMNVSQIIQFSNKLELTQTLHCYLQWTATSMQQPITEATKEII